jgi:O-antigen ligase
LRKLEIVRLNPMGVLSVILFLVPVIGAISPKAMVPLFLVALIVLIGSHKLRGMSKFKPPLILSLGLSALIIWTTLSLIWAPVAPPGDWLILSLAGMFIAGLAFLGLVPRPNSDDRNLMENWFLAGYGMANLIFLFEAITGSWISRQVRGLDWVDVIGIISSGQNLDAFLSNGIVILVLLVWPAVTILNRRKKWGWTITAMAGVPCIAILLEHSASLLAITLGLFAWGMARLSRKLAAKIIAATFIILVIAMPYFVGKILDSSKIHQFANSNFGRSMPNSVVPRLSIWEFTARQSRERPVLGWGLNSSRILPGGGDKAIIYDERVGNGRQRQLHNESYLPLHPHNQALQIWLELGGVAAVIVAIFGGMIIDRFSVARIAEAPLFGLIASYFVFAFSSFGAWQNWWIAVLFLVTLIWKTLCRDPNSMPGSVS